MSHDVRVKIQASTAAEVCQHVALGEEARALLQEEFTLQAFLDLLLETVTFRRRFEHRKPSASGQFQCV
jgi:hypothetical protein